MVTKMEKQTITGISNREMGTWYTLEKKSSFYEFYQSLLEALEVEQLPDLYSSETGKLPDAKQKEDSYTYWDDPVVQITAIFGANKIFLIIKTDNKEKLQKFMEENTEFKQ